jgi:hypothetical protein
MIYTWVSIIPYFWQTEFIMMDKQIWQAFKQNVFYFTCFKWHSNHDNHSKSLAAFLLKCLSNYQCLNECNIISCLCNNSNNDCSNNSSPRSNFCNHKSITKPVQQKHTNSNSTKDNKLKHSESHQNHCQLCNPKKYIAALHPRRPRNYNLKSFAVLRQGHPSNYDCNSCQINLNTSVDCCVHPRSTESPTQLSWQVIKFWGSPYFIKQFQWFQNIPSLLQRLQNISWGRMETTWQRKWQWYCCTEKYFLTTYFDANWRHSWP